MNTTNKNLNNYSIDNKYLNSNTYENEGDSRVNYIQNVNIYGWGRNKNGELGLGKNALQFYSNPQ
jgi:alpha-tubulin suppressor-like RCC1 family protein